MIAEVLFNYLKDAMYNPDKARLDIEALPESFENLGRGLVYFVECVKEARDFSKALANGNLNAKQPRNDNELAAPLKALQASLRHISWQSQQVAKGDYRQKLDFMGDFAKAFNTMTQQLDERQRTLEDQIDRIRKQTIALEQSNSLFVALTEGINNWIVVLDSDTREMLFANRTAQRELDKSSWLGKELWKWLMRLTQSGMWRKEKQEHEIAVTHAKSVRYFLVSSYPLHWKDRCAVAHVLVDVSAERMYMRELESHAYKDNLTRLYSRYFGMQVLQTWIAEHREFSLCFIDLDNLKFVNDTFGHAEGDQYIVSVADAIKNIAPEAMYARLGGDEFMILVPELTAGEVGQKLNEVRALLAREDEQNVTPYRRSISYGIVQVDADNTLSSSALLELADERMYRFKRANRVARRAECVNGPEYLRPEGSSGCRPDFQNDAPDEIKQAPENYV